MPAPVRVRSCCPPRSAWLDSSRILAADESLALLFHDRRRAVAHGAKRLPHRPVRLIVTVPPAARPISSRARRRKAVRIAGPAGARGEPRRRREAPSPPTRWRRRRPTAIRCCRTRSRRTGRPHLYAKLPYDPVKDFAPVSGLALLPLIMAVNAELPPERRGASSTRKRTA